MSQFKVHVQYIIYGCCGIELLIGNKLIKCDAGYGGPNPLASLIEACLDFSIAKKEGYESEDYIEETETTWDEEPGEMHLELKLLKTIWSSWIYSRGTMKRTFFRNGMRQFLMKISKRQLLRRAFVC